MTLPPEQETRMADTQTIGLAPVTEEAFVADRQKFFSEFTGYIFWAATGVTVLLILLAIFLL